MSLTLSTIERTYRYYSQFNKDNNKYCDIIIKINEIQYENGDIFYELSYNYKFSSGLNIFKNPLNPFLNHSPEFKHHWEGDIIIKNTMTEQMVNYLVMSEEEMSTFTGSTTPLDYKLRIMICLSKLWD